MDQKQEMAVSKMRELVETQGIPTQKFVDQTFLRFLKAKSMNPEKAAKMFVEREKWREEFVPLGFIPESEIVDQLEFLVYLFDRAIGSSFKEGREIGNEKIIAAVDLKSFPYKSIDARGFSITFNLLK
ncbi:hypothetical protein C5167_023502, partial [Papaver somniferum]